MCGIVGFLHISGSSLSNADYEVLQHCRDTLWHRGPDDQGIWLDAEVGIGLGHRRLAILDLSIEGHQPMWSPNKRYRIVYNGEIYNFKKLRNELVETGYQFCGNSDTEVILAAIQEWGLVRSLKRFIGMFAFALWDQKLQKLHLARDRVGIKPLYYGRIRNTLFFASELKAFRTYPGFDNRISQEALHIYARYNYIPAPFTIYEGVNKLKPGCYITFGKELDNSASTPNPYWDIEGVVRAGAPGALHVAAEEAIPALDKLIEDAVQLRMVADVPIGAFLSGGVDSSCVVAFMQKLSTRPVKTFSIGFRAGAYDEASEARAVAQHFGTDHTELYVEPQDALNVIPFLPTLYDEPFADSSQIPTYLVSKLAREEVTVSLSGDGGDELFGGYNRHIWGQDIWNRVSWMPPSMRSGLGKSLSFLSIEAWDAMFKRINSFLPQRLRHRHPGDKVHKVARALLASDAQAFYQELVSHWRSPRELLQADHFAINLQHGKDKLDFLDLGQLMMYFDTVSYLPDDILVKVDRASMGVSLEARVPLLDHRIVEFAWTIPQSLKIRHGQGKWLLRQVLYQYIPSSLIERPKTGFRLPIRKWLQGPLREWAEELLDEQKILEQGLFKPRAIGEKWREHIEGTHNWETQLWNILMFQAWHEGQRTQVSNNV